MGYLKPRKFFPVEVLSFTYGSYIITDYQWSPMVNLSYQIAEISQKMAC